MNAVKRILHRIYTILVMPDYVMGTADFPVNVLHRR